MNDFGRLDCGFGPGLPALRSFACPGAVRAAGFGWRLLLLLTVLSLSVPVRAQGQTPTNPQGRPNVGQNDMGQDPSSDPNAREERQSLRERREAAGERLRERGDQEEAEEEKPAEEAAPTVIDQSAPPGEQPPGDGPTVVQGPEKDPAAQRPNAPQPPPARGQGGGAAAVTVVGGTTPFEPMLQRRLEWPELPQAGEPMTVEGPMPLPEFLQTISVAANWNVVASNEVQQTVLGFFILIDKLPAEAMEVLQQSDIYYTFDEPSNTLYVMSMKEALAEEFGETTKHEFVVRNAEVAYVESVLATLISPVGRAITDQRTGRIYVWDTQDNIDEMIKIVGDIDVPLNKEEFTITFADLPDIQALLQSLLSPNGRLVADPRTGQIFVWDSPGVLDQMRAAVARLDVPVETRTIALKFVDAENIVENLSSLMSERGLIQVDPRTNAVVITDLPVRINRMAELIETIDLPMETRTWRLAYADPEFVADELESQIPEAMGRIILNEELNQITVSGMPDRLDQIDKLMTAWDIARPQVHIEAFIVEVGNEVEREFNINWSYFGNNGSVPIVIQSQDGGPAGIAEPPGDGQAVSIGQLPYAVPAYGALQLDSAGNIVRPVLTNVEGETIIDRFGGNNLAVALNYLDQQNKATILSSPRITVEDGEEAIFENATRVPYVSSTTIFGGNFNNNPLNNNINNTNRVDFIDVGTILSVLPRISQDGNINLEIDAEDSTFVLRNILTNGQVSTIPEKTLRRAQTELRVDSGDTVVLGGLRRDRASKSVTRTPLLGDLPVVGRLFRNPSRESQNNTLLIFITTTIIGSSTDPEAVMLSQAEEDIATQLRYNKKNLWGRVAAGVTGGQNELRISIGESGEMHTQGQHLALEELLDEFQDAPPGVKVVLRPHPRAPADIVTQVSEAATAAGLKLEIDRDMLPIVPNYGDRVPAEDAAVDAVEKVEAAEVVTPVEVAPIPAPEVEPFEPAAVE